MFQNRMFMLSVLAVMALLVFSAVLPASAGPRLQGTSEAAAWAISGNTTIGGVVLSYTDGTPKTATSDSNGDYSFLVSENWIGTVTPSLSGYVFTPASRSYDMTVLDADQVDQDYTAVAMTSTVTPTSTETPTETATPTQTATTTETATSAMTATRTTTPTKTVSPTRTATPTTPSGFSKIYPWKGTTGLNPKSITFSWKSYSPSPEKYRYCVDAVNNNECDATGGYTSLNATSVTLTNMTANTTYYWHVQAVICSTCTPKTIADTNSGMWWSFTTGAQPTSTPTITRTPTKSPTQTFTPKPTRTKTPISLSVTSAGANDGWILESTETSNAGGSMDATSNVLHIGDGAADRQYRALLSFDTSGLPDTAVIQSATVKIRQTSPVGTNPFTILGPLRIDIRTGSFGSADALELADFSGGATAVKVATFNSAPANGW